MTTYLAEDTSKTTNSNSFYINPRYELSEVSAMSENWGSMSEIIGSVGISEVSELSE